MWTQLINWSAQGDDVQTQDRNCTEYYTCVWAYAFTERGTVSSADGSSGQHAMQLVHTDSDWTTHTHTHGDTQTDRQAGG